MGWVGLRWAVLGWVGLGWAALGCAGLGWAGLGCVPGRDSSRVVCDLDLQGAILREWCAEWNWEWNGAILREWCAVEGLGARFFESGARERERERRERKERNRRILFNI